MDTSSPNQMSAISQRRALHLLPKRFQAIWSFFSTWLGASHFDLATLAVMLTVSGTITSYLSTLNRWRRDLIRSLINPLTTSVTISMDDDLAHQVLLWVRENITSKRNYLHLRARTHTINLEEDDNQEEGKIRHRSLCEKRLPVQYSPFIGKPRWFFFQRRLFSVDQVVTYGPTWNDDDWRPYRPSETGVKVSCIGRSKEPIYKFLEACRERGESYVKDGNWVSVKWRAEYMRQGGYETSVRPRRELDSIHFDTQTKYELVKDVQNYLDPETASYYISHGIPYRRGYLLHGPPGTGKTSLAIALAGHFSLVLYLIHIPTVTSDNELSSRFDKLPARCIVLLEDIDAVGLKRRLQEEEDNKADDSDDEDEEVKEIKKKHGLKQRKTGCTLSGLLNILDGVTSQEGRIVLMTSNHADKLDPALIRPGRVDKQVFLGRISQKSAESMFIRMFTPDHASIKRGARHLVFGEGEKEFLAGEFSRRIPGGVFTPAQVQGYLLDHRFEPVEAVHGVEKWIEDDKAKKAAAKADTDAVKAWERRQGIKKRRKRLKIGAPVYAATKEVVRDRALSEPKGAVAPL